MHESWGQNREKSITMRNSNPLTGHTDLPVSHHCCPLWYLTRHLWPQSNHAHTSHSKNSNNSNNVDKQTCFTKLFVEKQRALHNTVHSWFRTHFIKTSIHSPPSPKFWSLIVAASLALFNVCLYLCLSVCFLTISIYFLVCTLYSIEIIDREHGVSLRCTMC